MSLLQTSNLSSYCIGWEELQAAAFHTRVVKGYMRDPGQQGDGDDIHTLLPPPYRLGAVDTHLISPVFLPFDIAKDRKITDNIYQNPDSCVL